MKKSLLTLGLLALTSKTNAINNTTLALAESLIQRNNIAGVTPYSDEIHMRNIGLISVATLLTGTCTQLAQSFPLTQQFVECFDAKTVAATTALLLKGVLDGSDEYKAKKQLYMDLQKVYRVKQSNSTIPYSPNTTEKSLFYRFKSIDEKIELLTHCITSHITSHYIV